MNIGNSNEPVTLLEELANKIIQASGKKGKIKAKINKEFSNTDREADREINFRYCDTTLAKKLLNYEPETSLDEGIKKVMDAGYIPLSWITSEKNYLIGLEPARSFLRGILSPLCLPISPPGQKNYYSVTALPFNFSQSFSGLTFKFVFQTPSRVVASKPFSLKNSIIACTSFGKQLPPKPNFPSGPGTFT